MADILREAPFGQIVRLLTRNKYFLYPEEKPDFHYPHCYQDDGNPKLDKIQDLDTEIKSNEGKETDAANDLRPHQTVTDIEKASRSSDDESDSDSDLERQTTLGLQRTQTLPFTDERLEIEQRLAIEKTKSRPIVPAKTADGTILADWYNTDDPANPQNWSQKKKALVALQIE